MPETTFFNFINRLRSDGTSPPILILYGFNEYLGEHIITEISRIFGQEKSEFNFKRYYFDQEEEIGWEDIFNEADSSSFFITAKKIITVAIRSEKKLSLNAAAKAAISRYIAKPNPDATLIVYVSLDVSRDDYKQLKKSKIESLLKSFQPAQPVSIDLDKTPDAEIKNYVKQYLKERKITITVGAMERIQEIKGDAFASIIQQLPKLEAAAAQSLNIDIEEVDELITGINSHSIWDLTEAIEREDPSAYLDILKYLFINGIKPTFIIGTLISYYHKIYTAKFLMKHRFSVPDIGKVLQQPSFILNKFIALVRNFPDYKIQEVLKLIYKLDYESKTSGEDSARISLQNFIFQVKFLKK
ncbi:MAG: DNA polymerase III subunit delta [Candidatus Aminicenantes bacterium]|nr:DNA polymerase III subunit delta [Candidatus Aminicenantes bacterium]